MKKILILAVCSLVLSISCKTDRSTQEKEASSPKEITILEKVANAHGYEDWKDIANIKFTFNVDRDSSHFERTWSWNTKTHMVIKTTRQDTISYNRKAVDSTTASTDGGFVNDKFWLLAPFQLVWDQNNFSYEHIEQIEAPISKQKMHKLTTVYANEGGYTPGDAYDYYFGDDYIIKEWAFRKANQKEPNMVTTWEEYKKLSGLNISTMHKRPDTDFSLYFTGVEVKQ
ncbi:hypothetical protein Q2T41_04585 [Maribacter confluentis]|uniref:Uncharacterized protein n=1 Tax=Maribacter confluentis TaxID=1656093 RepID=A0ABT8RLY2_9FLAO|nr:hypothetical protein [Maribacter confluentis]MDO1511938.1 hypothetical protein [Maribacter confluentis]